MKGRTRRGGRIGAIGLAVLLGFGCDDRRPGDRAAQSPADDQVRTQQPATDQAAPGGAARWQARVLAHAPRGFRPVAWEDDQTIVGLVRSRIVRAGVATAVVATTDLETAWSVTVAPGVTSWSNESGWWVQRAAGEPELRVRMEDAPPGTDGPPEVLWSPDGSRALLTWSGEGTAVHALAYRAHRALDTVTIRLGGYAPARPRFWLDTARIVVSLHALRRHDLGTEAREAGQRGELAVHEVATGRTHVVAPTEDDHFLVAAGLVAPDSVLVLEHNRHGARLDAWAYDSGTWERRRRPLPDGRAFPHPSGRVAVLDARADGSALSVVEGSVVTPIDGVHPAEAEPVVWAPDGRRLAVLDESLTPSRVVVVERQAP